MLRPQCHFGCVDSLSPTVTKKHEWGPWLACHGAGVGAWWGWWEWGWPLEPSIRVLESKQDLSRSPVSQEDLFLTQTASGQLNLLHFKSLLCFLPFLPITSLPILVPVNHQTLRIICLLCFSLCCGKLFRSGLGISKGRITSSVRGKCCFHWISCRHAVLEGY